MTREQLLTAVWDYSSATLTRTLDTHIATLRKKIEDVPSNPRFIVTVHRIGYKFAG
jgi:DNA-binding response OmpR family regulator